MRVRVSNTCRALPGRDRVIVSLVAGAAVAGFVLTGAAGAAGLPQPPPVAYPPSFGDGPFFNEFRAGGLYHGVGNPERNTADVNLEILSRPLFVPADPTWSWFAPRLQLGGNINTAGRTSYGYTGLAWTWENVLVPRVFAEFSFGAAFHDGYTAFYAPDHRAKLGCVALFRESGSIGYRLTEHWSIMATIDHVSNGGLCDENRGITNVGGRLGYTF